jgi:hypothetical protein
VCREYKWDYWTYLDQPYWFIKAITERMKIDGVKAKAEEAKSARN